MRLNARSDSLVQLVAEASFDRLKDFDWFRYVRRCVGSTGFGRCLGLRGPNAEARPREGDGKKVFQGSA